MNLLPRQKEAFNHLLKLKGRTNKRLRIFWHYNFIRENCIIRQPGGVRMITKVIITWRGLIIILKNYGNFIKITYKR